MTTLKLITAPDKRLSTVAKPVDKVDDSIRKILDEMLQVMYKEKGIGMAANQVGILKRILVMDLQENGISKPYFVVNPEIIKSSNKLNEYKEGNISFPEIKVNAKRPEKVTVKYFDYDGNEQILNCDGLLATCIQHEIDHLNGITFIDHLSNLKRSTIMRKVIKIKKKINSN